MGSFLQLFRSSRREPVKPPAIAPAAMMERLEDRQLMSASVHAAYVILPHSPLYHPPHVTLPPGYGPVP